MEKTQLDWPLILASFGDPKPLKEYQKSKKGIRHRGKENKESLLSFYISNTAELNLDVLRHFV